MPFSSKYNFKFSSICLIISVSSWEISTPYFINYSSVAGGIIFWLLSYSCLLFSALIGLEQDIITKKHNTIDIIFLSIHITSIYSCCLTSVKLRPKKFFQVL